MSCIYINANAAYFSGLHYLVTLSLGFFSYVFVSNLHNAQTIRLKGVYTNYPHWHYSTAQYEKNVGT